MLAVLQVLPVEAWASCGAHPQHARKVSTVQGDGPSSPLVGQTVTLEGVITMDSRQPGGWRGFYLQQADGETDNNPRTSEAIFVYTDRADGSVGSRVRVTGRVKEYHGLTELTQVSDLTVCGTAPLPEAIPVQLPWPGQQAPEHLENMRVTLTQPLTLVGHYGFARYGELVLAGQPQVVPTELLAPGRDARALAREQALNRLHLDDGSSARNPDPLPWPARKLADGEPVRAGDRITDLTGILDYRFGQWRLQPSREPRLFRNSQRPQAPTRKSEASVRVVTFNLGNFFNGDGRGNGFEGSRGARNETELRAQRSRLIAALTALDADIIAAVEIENDDYSRNSALAMLVKVLGPDWRFVATPRNTGTDAIRTDLLYRADRVRALGQPQRLTRGKFGWKGRPPLAQLFQPVDGNERSALRVVVPHFKSKACGGATGADQDQNDGQGCYARRRTDAAASLAHWLDSLPEPEDLTGRFAGTLVTGDLNSYARERPIQRLEQAGFTNLVRTRHACTQTRCGQTSYRYQGRHGSLDYSLGSESLLEHVVDAGVWTINAEEFPALGYRGPLAGPADSPWRSSDHNPVYTDLAL